MTQAHCDVWVQKGGNYPVAVFVAVDTNFIPKFYICQKYLETFLFLVSTVAYWQRIRSEAFYYSDRVFESR